ncbi:MAG: hypothetical protein H7A32_04130 [Deltaproteobacteria bacterium]|nr:hypothetical protein [Deltaproteobacteria bacterium]
MKNIFIKMSKCLILLGISLGFMSSSFAEESKTIKYNAVSLDVEVYVSALDLVQDNSITPPGDSNYLLQKAARFYVDGKIVPGGTWAECGTDASCWEPKVIGTWYCDAVNANNINFGDPTLLNLPEIFSNQLFLFNDGSGNISDDQIVGLGSNPAPGGPATLRPIIGGSGAYAGAQGQQLEAVIGGDGAFLIVAAFDIRMLVPDLPELF